MPRPSPDALAHTTSWFDAASGYWSDVYGQSGVEGAVYRQRLGLVLHWVDELGPAPGAAALDVGCGAGLLCVELAERGLNVTGTDSSPAMLELARSRADQHAVGERVELAREDAHQLSYPAGRFDLVTALGLLPWVSDERAVVRELARVLRPGGHLVLTADNRARLNSLVEPQQNPLLTPLKLARRSARRALQRRRGVPPEESILWRMRMPRQVDRLAREAGLTPLRRTTVGFGPFTFMGRSLLSEAAGLRLHERLVRRAEHNRLLRSAGWNYVVLCVKPQTDPAPNGPRG